MIQVDNNRRNQISVPKTICSSLPANASNACHQYFFQNASKRARCTRLTSCWIWMLEVEVAVGASQNDSYIWADLAGGGRLTFNAGSFSIQCSVRGTWRKSTLTSTRTRRRRRTKERGCASALDSFEKRARAPVNSACAVLWAEFQVNLEKKLLNQLNCFLSCQIWKQIDCFFYLSCYWVLLEQENGQKRWFWIRKWN